jgi:hypothetical protein
MEWMADNDPAWRRRPDCRRAASALFDAIDALSNSGDAMCRPGTAPIYLHTGDAPDALAEAVNCTMVTSSRSWNSALQRFTRPDDRRPLVISGSLGDGRRCAAFTGRDDLVGNAHLIEQPRCGNPVVRA